MQQAALPVVVPKNTLLIIPCLYGNDKFWLAFFLHICYNEACFDPADTGEHKGRKVYYTD